jgi:hypothetical protein
VIDGGTAVSEERVDGVRAGLHLRFGFWGLFAFVCLGLALEAFHGFKIRFYLDVANDTRRLLWTLAHAHGVLLSLLNIVFALLLRTTPELSSQNLAAASRCLLAAAILLPGGFFLGGVVIHAGDPGLGVALAPLGALLLLYAVLQTARAVERTFRR